MSIGRGPKGERLYRCRSKHASGKCPQPAMITADSIEPHVEGLILDEIEGMMKFVPDSQDRERLLAELAQARAEYDDFRRDRETRRKLGPEDWHDSLDVYLAAVKDLEVQLDQMDQRVGVVREADAPCLRGPSPRRAPRGPGRVHRHGVRPAVSRARENVDPVGDRARILWRGQGPDDLPRRRVVNEIRSFNFEDDVEAGVAAAENGA